MNKSGNSCSTSADGSCNDRESESNSILNYKNINEHTILLKYLKEYFEIKIQFKERLNDNSCIILSAKKEGTNTDCIYESIITLKILKELEVDPMLLEHYDNNKTFFLFLLDSFIEKRNMIKYVDNLYLILDITFNESLSFEIKLKMKDNSMVKTIEILRNKVNDLEKENRLLKFKLNNHIIENESEQKFIIDRLLQIPGCENKNITLKLIYRLSHHGSNIENFHKICDNIPNNLTIVKTTEYERFGGFSQLPWILPSPGCIFNTTKFGQANSLFCFSLSKMKIYNSENKNSYVISCNKSGPDFVNYFNIGSSNSLNIGYCSVVGKSFKSDITNHRNSFELLEMEVFQVLFE